MVVSVGTLLSGLGFVAVTIVGILGYLIKRDIGDIDRWREEADKELKRLSEAIVRLDTIEQQRSK